MPVRDARNTSNIINNDAMQRLRNSFNSQNNKPGLVEKLTKKFLGKKADPVQNIKTMISKADSSSQLKAKDTLLMKSILERQIEKHIKAKPIAEQLIPQVNNLLAKADFTFRNKEPSWKCSTDMRISSENSTDYQNKVEGQIKRDIVRGGIVIIGDDIYDDNAKNEEKLNLITHKLISDVMEKSSIKEPKKIIPFLQRAMIMGTQHVMNDAFVQYVQAGNPQPKNELPGLTKFTVNNKGIKLERQTVFEKIAEPGMHTKSEKNQTETVFYASAFMSFDQYLNDKELSAPRKFL